MTAATLRPIAAAVVMPKNEIHIIIISTGFEPETPGSPGVVPAEIQDATYGRTSK
jgi:hypothetical protein